MINTHGGEGYQQALLQGLKYVTADYIAFQDSDDVSHPSRIYEQLELLKQTRADITGCLIEKTNEKLEKLPSKGGVLHKSNLHHLSLLFGSYSANSTWLITKRVAQDSDFMTSPDKAIDWSTGFLIFPKYKIQIVRKKYYYYRQHGNQMTDDPVYQKHAFPEIYPLWQKCNTSYGLPPLSIMEANLIANPWDPGVFTSSHVIWKKALLKVTKNLDAKSRSEFKALIGIRFLKYLTTSKNILNFSLLSQIAMLSPWILCNYLKQIWK
jgi:glycosyltransferase involved in cell wall biosynthesis